MTGINPYLSGIIENEQPQVLSQMYKQMGFVRIYLFAASKKHSSVSKVDRKMEKGLQTSIALTPSNKIDFNPKGINR